MTHLFAGIWALLMSQRTVPDTKKGDDQVQAEKIDEKPLCKKYRTNVARLIRSWKKGLSDFEISKETGIDPLKLQIIKSDIEMAHRRLRQAKKNSSQLPNQAGRQRHIFFNPFM